MGDDALATGERQRGEGGGHAPLPSFEGGIEDCGIRRPCRSPQGLGRRTRIGCCPYAKGCFDRRPARDLACSVASEPVAHDKQRPTVPRVVRGGRCVRPGEVLVVGPHVSGLGAQCPPELAQQAVAPERTVARKLLCLRAGQELIVCHRGLLLRQLNSRSVGCE